MFCFVFISEYTLKMEGTTDQNELCLLCEERLIESENVCVKKGMSTLVEASKKRGDDKWQKWVNLSTIQVHVKCRKDYTREKSIKAANRKDTTDQEERGSPIKQKIRSKETVFDFKKKCIFCFEECCEKEEKKKPLHRRQVVSRVMTLDFGKNVLDKCINRNDDWGKKVKAIIVGVHCLVAEEARYHRSCSSKFFSKQHLNPSGKRGRPDDEDIVTGLEKVCSYMEDSDDCQFTLQELLDVMHQNQSCKTSASYLKTKLQEKYGNDVIITTLQRKTPIVCFRKSGDKLLCNSWYNEKLHSEKEERLRIVRTAAAIIKEDIKSKVYDSCNYPSPEGLFNDVENNIPDSLHVLLHEIIEKGGKGDTDNKHRVCSAIAHSVLQAVRPRTFVSPILLGVAVYVHRKFGSKLLVHILHKLGFSTGYNEAQLFEASCMKTTPPTILSDSFMQFVFDNADFDVHTIDGFHTFHCMGGIECVTPAGSMIKPDVIERLKKMPSAKEISSCSSITVKPFTSHSESGLKRIEIEDLKKLTSNPSEKLTTSSCQLLWMSGKWMKFKDIPHWNGFMDAINNSEDFDTTSIRFLPFLDLKATSSDAINSVLHFASDSCRKASKSVTCVTFDQPLYWKAKEILSSTENSLILDNVFLRLGGFHLLMSFMGSIGYIMAGSGLKEVWETVYAPKSTDKMMTGHSFARALRAHLLTHAALGQLLLDGATISDEDKQEVQSMLQQYNNKTLTATSVKESPIISSIVKKFNTRVQEVASSGKTAMLWIQYFQMVTLMLHYIEAERLGKWELHLLCVQEFIPYFHAAGHLAYAKSCHLYLQDMHDLHQRMPDEDFVKFTEKGFFTIRRSNKNWAGLWSDLTVEQTLMRTMKTSGGLTHGRGITDSVLSRWILGMPATCEMCTKVEEFCGLRSSYSEQHIELRPSRIVRDNEDTGRISQWFLSHPPFSDNKEIMSLATGIIGDDKINCYKSYEIGLESMNAITGQTFSEVKLKRKNRVLPLATINSSVTIREDIVPVDTTLLFQRIIHTLDTSTADLQDYFQYELAPMPPALFTEQGMRKTNKAAMYSVFNDKSTSTTFQYLDEAVFIVDGGFLLHRVVWPSHIQGITYDEVYEAYISYIKQYYHTKAVIVFDGYSDSKSSTKYAERQRRSRTLQTTDIIFDPNTKVCISQEKFLSNEHNKSRFISQLSRKLDENGISVKQAPDDADLLIIQTAIRESLNSESTIAVVGEDVDLLILLTALTPESRNITFLKPGRGKVPARHYNSSDLQASLGSLKDYILFIHAASGCDTVSSLFGQGKLKLLRLLQKKERLRKHVDVFNSKTSTQKSVADAGEKLLIDLYGGPDEELELNSFRLKCFRRATVRCKRQVKLERLPPTAEASKQHFLRVYHQVQLWQSNPLSPEQWGWIKGTDGLVPVTTDLPPAPEKLLHLISCTCTKNCVRNCSCVKGGLKCSIVCVCCRGVSCSNSTIQSEEELMDELETPSRDTDESDNEDHEESIEPEEMYHANQQEISCEEPVNNSGTAKSSVLPSTSTSVEPLERPRKSLRSQI